MTIHITWPGLLGFIGGLAIGGVVFTILGWLILMAQFSGWDAFKPMWYLRWRSDRRVRKYRERKARDGEVQDR